MDVVLDRVVLGRETEGVPADGIQDVPALQPALARYGIKSRVGTRMPHVQTLTRRVGELNQGVELGLVRVGLGMENALVLPYLLPFRLDGFVIVFHIFSSRMRIAHGNIQA